MIDEEDRYVAEGIRAGDPRAIEFLYDRYSRRAFGLAYRILGDSARAEDAVQEAFLIVWRQASRIDPARGKPQSLLMTVVHHKAIDILRSERGQAPRNVLLDPDVVDDESDTLRKVERTLDRETAQKAVRKAPSALTQSQRESIELAYFNGLTHVEIADRLAVPLGTVKSRLRLGPARMRSALATEPTSPTTICSQKRLYDKPAPNTSGGEAFRPRTYWPGRCTSLASMRRPKNMLRRR
ncbi:MAG: sigma-70 family RNA polymerase sigma factor [Chloroflexi bacterium]|nr:sigma-70 family RNA polymerase sigma factor [Chloroflexota bacterium]